MFWTYKIIRFEFITYTRCNVIGDYKIREVYLNKNLSYQKMSKLWLISPVLYILQKTGNPYDKQTVMYKEKRLSSLKSRTRGFVKTARSGDWRSTAPSLEMKGSLVCFVKQWKFMKISPAILEECQPILTCVFI